MAMRSGSLGVSLGMLARWNIFANRRLPHVATALGDSRADAMYLEPAQRNRNARSPLNVANSLIGHRLTIGQTFGRSGDRTDHLFARLDAAIATGAGLLHLWCGVNNVAKVASGGFTYNHEVTGELVTIANVAAVTMRDLRDICAKALRAGMIVVLENEVGSKDLSSAEKITALMDLRQMIAEYGDATPGVYVHDAYTTLMQATTTTPSFKTGLSYDGVHENARGAFKHARSLAALLSSIVPPRASVLSKGMNDVRAYGRRQLLLNHLFTTTNGGTAASGVTGNVPASFTTTAINATASLTSGANASGVGNYVECVIDFTAMGGTFRLNQALDAQGGTWNSALVVGDWVEAVSEVEIIGTAGALAGVALELTGYDGAANFGSMDLVMPVDIAATDLGPDEPCVLTLRTRPTQIPPRQPGTNPYVAIILRVRSVAAGQVTLRVRQIALRRRMAA
ncbi:MAG: SGNH/GDSL hydrolase family protein [Sphingomonas paucimobilis]